jgi:hypothetical protein
VPRGRRVDHDEVVRAALAIPALELGQLPDLRDGDELLRARRRRDEVLERRGPQQRPEGAAAQAAELAREPLLERLLRVDRDRPQVLAELDLGLLADPLRAKARETLSCSATSQYDGAPAAPAASIPSVAATVVLPTPPYPVTVEKAYLSSSMLSIARLTA